MLETKSWGNYSRLVVVVSSRLLIRVLPNNLIIYQIIRETHCIGCIDIYGSRHGLRQAVARCKEPVI